MSCQAPTYGRNGAGTAGFFAFLAHQPSVEEAMKQVAEQALPHPDHDAHSEGDAKESQAWSATVAWRY